ncbi:MAG TPA: hypothetical protein VFN55_11140 [Solirubrobacteraceae bacterium]|nr:hypothetical protein [Solirubrobacteraceae bacterium]
MGLRPRAFLAGILGFTVAFVVACGGGNGLLSSGQAGNLSGKVDAVESALGAHNCGGARNAAQNLQNAVAALPSTINTTLAQNLGQGASTLSQLASRDCTTSTSHSTSTSTSTSTSSTPTTTATVTKTHTQTTQTTQATATNPGPTGTSPTSSNGGAGIGTTPGNQNGQ